MQSADAYFKKGIYENRVVAAVTSDDGLLKVGVKSTSMPSNYWAIFDNFRLYYYGSKSVDEVTAVPAIQHSEIITANSVYDLQGRKVSEPGIRKGIYIVNGKKMIVR